MKKTLLLSLLCCLCMLLFCNACGDTNTATSIAHSSAPPPLLSHQGNGYKISYPQGWTVESGPAKANPVKDTFTDNKGHDLTVFVYPTTNGLTAAKVLQMSLVPNAQSVNVDSTKTLHGAAWQQRSQVGNFTPDGKQAKKVILVTEYPAQSLIRNVYSIVYSAPTQDFDTVEKDDFSPMLLSFTFQPAQF